jgi:hypothetical protein
MKLKYRISRPTNLTREVLIEKILSKIKEEKYGVVSVTPGTVTFNSDYGGLVWNWEYLGRLDSGAFEIVIGEEHNDINLEYCPIELFEYLWVFFLMGCAIVFSFTISNAMPAIISLIFLMQLIFKFFHLKNSAVLMLDEIAT